MRFADEVQASFPAGFVLPSAIRLALDWLEEQGCVRRFDRGAARYAMLYPADLTGSATTIASFVPVATRQADYWLGFETPETVRLAPFINTGGDGSYAALWLDPEGRQRFIHMGSGSGSAWAGILADDPVDVLRFLAIGYTEPCWSEYHHAPPEELARDGDFVPPLAFQEWVTRTFGVTIPRTGRDIVAVTPDMGDDTSDDAFLCWVRQAQASIEQR